MAGESALATGLGLRGDARIKIPGWKPLDTVAEQAASISGNLENFGLASELTSKANVFNVDQIMMMLRKAIPNFDAIVGKQSELLQSGLRGEVPKDVQDQLTLRSASKAVSGGYAGSGAHRNLEARDFGLTSFDITQKALSSAQSWTESMGRLTQPGLMNIGASFISPQQRIAQTNYDKENIWTVQMMKNIEKAKPSNWEKFGAQMLDYVAATGQSVTSAYLGNLTGGQKQQEQPMQQQQQQQPQYQQYQQQPVYNGGGGSSWGGQYGETPIKWDAFDF